jgi:hypothetical protein
MTSRTAAILFGIVFILVGIMGFFANPIVGTNNSIFHADTVHNLVHIISGTLFLIFAFAAPGNVSAFMKTFGVIYFLIGMIGLLTIASQGETKVLGFLHLNGPDNYLHIALGLAIFLMGMLPKYRINQQATSAG